MYCSQTLHQIYRFTGILVWEYQLVYLLVPQVFGCSVSTLMQFNAGDRCQ